jgi:hypothetical protein
MAIRVDSIEREADMIEGPEIKSEWMQEKFNAERADAEARTEEENEARNSELSMQMQEIRMRLEAVRWVISQKKAFDAMNHELGKR